MTKEIQIIDRSSKIIEKEKVYGNKLLYFIYGNALFFKILFPILPFLGLTLFSRLFGWWQNTRWSTRYIQPFIKSFRVDSSEFQKKAGDFSSFNDFFIRKLKPESRPTAQGEGIAVLPVDGRYLFFSDIRASDGFYVKGEKFSLASFLDDEELAIRYERGSMVIARLSPVDCHRVYFPIDSQPAEARRIPGYLYSVNPLAIKKNIQIFTKNKRVVTLLQSLHFGQVVQVEVGATNVGTIIQTFSPGKFYRRGEEKGYFAFGGSTVVLLFEPNRIVFEPDLLSLSTQRLEVKASFGQAMGRRYQK